MSKEMGVIIEKIVNVIPSRAISNGLMFQETEMPASKAEKVLSVAKIRQRRRWNKSVDLMYLCEKASLRLMEGTDPSSIGLVFFVTSAFSKPPQPLPKDPAEHIRRSLGLKSALALSVTSDASQLSPVRKAFEYVRQKKRKVLLVGFDFSDSYTKSGVSKLVFGDTCMSVLISPSDDPSYGFSAMENAGEENTSHLPAFATKGNDNSSEPVKDSNLGFIERDPLSYPGATNFEKACHSLTGFFSEKGRALSDIDFILPLDVNLSPLEQLSQSHLKGKEVHPSYELRGYSKSLAFFVAIQEGLSKSGGQRRQYLACGFSAGGSFDCAYYHSSGKEEVVFIEETPAPNYLSRDRSIVFSLNANGFLAQSDGVAKPFTILSEASFDKAPVKSHRLLAKNLEDIEFFFLALKEHCEIRIEPEDKGVWADLVQAATQISFHSLERSWNPLEKAELIDRCFDRIPPRNSALTGAAIAWSVGATAPEKIAKHFVHKHFTDNVNLSKNYRVGNLNYFNAFPESKEFVFDHPSDHVQGILIMEFARQAMIATFQIMGLAENDINILERADLMYRRFVQMKDPIVVRTFALPLATPGDVTVKALIAVQIIQNDRICVSGKMVARCVSAERFKMSAEMFKRAS